MSYKEILVPVISLQSDLAALNAGATLAHAFDTHATALIVSVDLASAFASADSTFSEIALDIAKGSHSRAAVEREKILGWLGRAPHAFEVRDVTIEDAVNSNEVLAHARMSDLTLMVRDGRAHRALLERVLFHSGRPLLLLPKNHERLGWDRILIGWNAKTQATRAVTAALPLLKLAGAVVVATIDASPSRSGHGEAPGRDLAAHLASHDVRVEVRNLDSMGRDHARVLLDEAAGFAADIVVIGAYGHSRAREMLFGGVTREVLASADVPLLMAH